MDTPLRVAYVKTSVTSVVDKSGWEVARRVVTPEAAARIVAAVNACQGISSEALESGAVKAMAEACAAKDAEIERLATELAEARAENLIIHCAFCGHTEPRGDDVSGQMAAHVVKCGKHPMNAMAVEYEKLKSMVGPETSNPAHEEQARKFREAMATTEDGKPEGTLEALATCAKMLNTYAPDCFPANEKGQVHFARVMMETTADEITAHLATIAKGTS